MKKKSTKKKIIILLIGLLLLIIDQVAKFMLINQNILLIPDVLEFSYSENSGVVLGLIQGDMMIIMIVSIVILGILARLLKKYFDKGRLVYATALVLVFAGGLSNLIDRILRGFVVDYLQIKLFSFPIFNLADLLIIIGIIILFVLIIIDLVVPEKKRKEKEEIKKEKKKEKIDK